MSEGIQRKAGIDWSLGIVQLVVTAAATIGSIIIFSFTTFQTKAEANREREVVDDRLRIIEDMVSDLKLDTKERHIQLTQSLQSIQEHLLQIRQIRHAR